MHRTMFRNYLKIALRHLAKNRGFALINALGLAVGMATVIFILQYLGFELGVNRFHANLPQMYRLLCESKEGGTHEYMYAAVAPAAKENLADVADYCRVANGIGNGIVGIAPANGQPAKSFREDGMLFVEGNFFEFFSFPILEGSAQALKEPFTVAISAQYAKKYFGKTSALNQVLMVSNQFHAKPYRVVVVFKDMPENSDLRGNLALSLETLRNPNNIVDNPWVSLDNWETQYSNAYLTLKPGSDYLATESKINQIYKGRQPKSDVTLRLQPVTEMHLGPSLDYPYPTSGRLWFVYLLGGVAALILAIAWFNYINLSTVSSLKRAKEVGIRKVSGAGRGALVGQFLGESLLLNGLGFALALGLVSLVQPLFNELIGRNLSLGVLAENGFWAVGLGFLVIGTLLSGGYTAFAISAFPAVSVLKGTFSRSAKGAWVRKSLIVFQFGISILLMVGTLGLYHQLQFMLNKDLGMNPEQVLVIRGPEIGKDSTFAQRAQSFRQAIGGLAFVKNVSSTGAIPGSFFNFMANKITKLSNAKPGDETKTYSFIITDQQYLETFGIQLVAGNNFTPEMSEKGFNSGTTVINETAARSLGFANSTEAVGQKIRAEFSAQQILEMEVIGVIKDYHHLSVQASIAPLVMIPQYNPGNFAIRLNTTQVQDKVTQLEKLFGSYFAGNPFDYFFVDENYNRQYQAERQFGEIFTIASVLAIFVACLGLFGLAAYTAEQRTKEIGIRKVLGANLGQLVGLLSQDFLKLVGIAFVIASPLAYYGLSKWLENFAYKTDLAWWVFALAGGGAAVLALATVSWQSIRAALANPVKSLRSE
jgi:putative ABC transport system permease protein